MSTHSARTDVHAPSRFEPADYEVLDYYDNQRPQYCGQPIAAYELEIKQWSEDMERAFGPEWRRKIHHCAHCGNGRVRWITAVLHRPTNEVIVFGSDCTHRLGFANRVAFKLAMLQKRAEGRAIRLKVFQQREAFVAAHPTIKEALDAVTRPEHAQNTFVQDVLRKLDQYGSLSDKQVAAVEGSLKRDRERAEQRVHEAVEVKGPAPSGRQQVTGTILSIQDRETDFGVVTKMLVKLENNSKVWSTVPGNADVQRGDTITFVATFEVSKDDASFSFGKRPRFVSKKESV